MDYDSWPDLVDIRGDGGHLIHVWDSEENQGVRFFPIDTTPPSVILAADPDISGWYGLDDVPIELSLEATDLPSGLATVEYRINGSDPTLYSGPFTISDVDTVDNVVTVEYFATDNAGNTSDPQQRPFEIDVVPPVITILNPADGGPFEMGVDIGTYEFTCEDAIGESGAATCAGTVGAGDFLTDTTTIDTSEERDFSLVVTATDNAGNTSELTHGLHRP